MRILLIVFALMLAFSGCAVKEQETSLDVPEIPAQTMRELTFALPKDADTQVMESNAGKLYFCDGYEIMVQTYPSGDVDQTLRQLSGHDRGSMTVIQTGTAALQRYDCVWIGASEQGDQVSRAVMLDDGSYHYCISVTALAADAGSLTQCWQELLSSVALGD